MHQLNVIVNAPQFTAGLVHGLKAAFVMPWGCNERHVDLHANIDLPFRHRTLEDTKGTKVEVERGQPVPRAVYFDAHREIGLPASHRFVYSSVGIATTSTHIA